MRNVGGVVLASVVALALGGTALAAPAPAPAPKRAEVHALKVTVLSTMMADDGIGEWGFAALVECDGKKILYDTGARPRTVLENAGELNIDLADVEDVVLSHFHSDHTTGLLTLRRELAAKNPAALSRVHVGKGMFRPRRGMDNKMIGIRQEVEATGARFIEHDEAAEIFPGVWVTGNIPRPNPERNYPLGIQVAQGDDWVADDVPEDQALAFNAPKGLVVITGCGHAGIVNTLQHVRTSVRDAPFLAIMGGFHLYDAKPATIDWTAGKLKAFHVTQILGAHCTGIETVYILRQRMGLARKDCLVATIGATFDLASGIHTGSISG